MIRCTITNPTLGPDLKKQILFEFASTASKLYFASTVVLSFSNS
jgi:hypothetical protein